MELQDLVGEHELSGLDSITVPATENSFNDDADAVLFILDGVTYKAIEDPDDGYRSYLHEIEVSDEKVSYTFPPQKVIGKMKEDGSVYSNSTIQFFDATNGKLVLEIGTDDYDDYYPVCVLNWHPENLSSNN